MASKLSFLNSLMERRKPPKDNNKTNGLAFVKAAAWAWFQHNSGSKEKTISEFDAIITRREPRPSRFKLEAMRLMAMEEARTSEGSSIHTKKLSLLDAYEVHSISRQLNSLIESSNHNKVVNGADISRNDQNVNIIVGKRMHKKKIRKGFWLRHGAVCGREEDVVDPSALRDERRLSVKQVPAVNLVKCLPMKDGAL